MFVSMANQTNPLEAKHCEFASPDTPITPITFLFWIQHDIHVLSRSKDVLLSETVNESSYWRKS